MAESRSRELRQSYEAPGVAEHYADGRWAGSRHARRTQRKEQRLVGELLAFAAAEGELARFPRVLDVPCGAGRFQSLLRQRCGELIAADIARPMLEQVSLAAPAAPAGSPRATAASLQASAAALPFAEASFDLVFCFRLLHHFAASEERRFVLRELARVCRRWALVSYFDAASFQAWRHRVRRRRTVRFAQPNRLFDDEAFAAGWQVRQRRWIARGLSEQVLALLEKRP